MPLLQLLIAALFVCGAAAQSIPGLSAARLQLSEGENAALRLRLNGADLPLPARSGVERDGITLRLEEDSLNIRTAARPLLLESDPGAWSMEVPANSSASVELSLAAKAFRLNSAAQNRASLILTFSDKGSAELLPGSSAELELFAENTYSLRARTNVLATTADGQKLNLSDLQPPMLGGELRQVTDRRGNSRFQRSSPGVELELSGALNESVLLKAPGLEVTLVPDQEKQITFPDGSTIVLRHVAARQILEWKILKGVCQLKVSGFSCWKSTTTSGQSGSLQWNPVRKIVDFSNRGTTPIFVQLTGRLHASIGPGGTFQYAQFQDCSSFTTSATGGDVFLVNRDTGEVTPVINAVSFSEGQRIGSGVERVEAPPHRVTFGWESEARIELRDSARLLGINGGQQDSIVSGENELQVTFAQSGDVIMRAARGSFEVLPGFIPELTFNIPENAAVVMTLDRRRGLFTARAAEDSGVATRVIAAGQTYMFLAGTAKLNVVVGQNTFIPETSAAWIFFEGAGGDLTFTSGLQPAPLIFPDRFDGSRILQQPVSVIE